MLKRQLSLLNPTLRWFLLAMILANISSETAHILLPVYLRELGATVAQVGLVFSVMSLVLLVLQLFGGLLSDALGRLRTIAPGSVAAATGYLLLPLSPSWEWVLLALCLGGISGAMVGKFWAIHRRAVHRGEPGTSVRARLRRVHGSRSDRPGAGRIADQPSWLPGDVVGGRCDVRVRGLASATLQTTFGLVHLPALWMGAQLWERWSPRAPFAVSAAAIVVSALPARLKLKRAGGRET